LLDPRCVRTVVGNHVVGNHTVVGNQPFAIKALLLVVNDRGSIQQQQISQGIGVQITQPGFASPNNLLGQDFFAFKQVVNPLF
jgi:hypothetical protein